MSKLLDDFLTFVRVNTRSDVTSEQIPTTKGQVKLAKILEKELNELGLEKVSYDQNNGYLLGKLAGNAEQIALGFIAHLDTADFNAENIQPQVLKNYDGNDVVLHEKENIILKVAEFPNLKDYVGQTLITTNGLTLLGADDKAGIAEILAMLRYFRTHPEHLHGDIWVAFGPDEEIGRGADLFPIEKFPVRYAYTVDSGRLGNFEYETFNAATITIEIEGVSVHPGTAYGQMVNAIKLGEELDASLPKDEVPEKTRGYEGFYLLNKFNGSIDHVTLNYIIRDHDEEKFKARKQTMVKIIEDINARFAHPRLTYEMEDQYYNMRQIIDQYPHSIELAKEAMRKVGITPNVQPFRGGTDGSKISLKGLPTPNIFTAGENFHGQYEFITLEGMEKATETLIEMVKLAGKYD
ncbi:peptidase T [Tetragenococcus solitarius]|uniref:Peptidase T n=1 Tax=Tetragenococcus solitarius TaxID=71453 RepID=A0ABP6KKD7_9ENTE|nr:peptidase T [Tetragenococcus solitarius]